MTIGDHSGDLFQVRINGKRGHKWSKLEKPTDWALVDRVERIPVGWIAEDGCRVWGAIRGVHDVG